MKIIDNSKIKKTLTFADLREGDIFRTVKGTHYLKLSCLKSPQEFNCFNLRSNTLYGMLGTMEVELFNAELIINGLE